MRISDWSSDVCSSDLVSLPVRWNGRKSGQTFPGPVQPTPLASGTTVPPVVKGVSKSGVLTLTPRYPRRQRRERKLWPHPLRRNRGGGEDRRSEEHTSELQSLMRNSYAVFCLQKKISPQRE